MGEEQRKNLFDKTIDGPEVMKRLRISRPTLNRWRKQGILVPTVEYPIGKYRYKIEDVEKILQQGL